MKPETYQERMRKKLAATLAPIHMEIIDDSARHAGHFGADAKGETHFKIKIVSDAFEGLDRVARHRLVYDAVAEELKERVHALNIDTLSQTEYNCG